MAPTLVWWVSGVGFYFWAGRPERREMTVTCKPTGSAQEFAPLAVSLYFGDGQGEMEEAQKNPEERTTPIF
jgi:hypothetical protein